MSPTRETQAERLAFALSGLSRVHSTNVNSGWVSTAPDESVSVRQRRAGHTSANAVYQYDPVSAAAAYRVQPETHRPKTDINRYAERALALRDVRRGAQRAALKLCSMACFTLWTP